MQSQPFLYGSSTMRLGFFRTSWLTETSTPSMGDSRSTLCPSRVTVAQLLPLPHPAVQIGDFDGVDLAEQISCEAIDADASVLPAFVHDPSVARMEGIIFGNVEASRVSP